MEEMLPLMPEGISHTVLDFGLHLRPEKLRDKLQEAIEAASEEADTIILGYGLCSLAVIGLKATNCTLVVPRVDDCIAIFLGSNEAYLQQAHKEVGTYYLTKGWIEVSDTLLDEHKRLIERYGQERADYVMDVMLKNYTRLAYIDTGQYDQDRYREHARLVAEHFGLRYEEIPGSNDLVRKMLFGPWEEDFVVTKPGETIRYEDFKSTEKDVNHGKTD
jgi:hypothetical protein